MLTPLARPKPLADWSSPLALTTWDRYSELNTSPQQLLTRQGQDLTQALLYLRNRNLKQAEEVM